HCRPHSTLFYSEGAKLNLVHNEKFSMNCVTLRLSESYFRSLTEFEVCDWLTVRNLHDPMIEECMLRIAKELENNEYGRDVMLAHLSHSILIHVARKLKRKALHHSRDISQLIVKITDYVNSQIGEAPRLSILADLCGISSGHLSRIFRHSIGMSVHGYINQIQMDRAKKLLKDKGYSIKEIAWVLGYKNSSSFCSAFKKNTGLRPKEYFFRSCDEDF